MAFATSNVRVESLGHSWLTTGTWTGAVGDAAGTLTVPGQQVLSGKFDTNLSSGGPTAPVAWSFSASNGVSTVSVYYHQTVTDGKFAIISR